MQELVPQPDVMVLTPGYLPIPPHPPLSEVEGCRLLGETVCSLEYFEVVSVPGGGGESSRSLRSGSSDRCLNHSPGSKVELAQGRGARCLFGSTSVFMIVLNVAYCMCMVCVGCTCRDLRGHFVELVLTFHFSVASGN